MKNKLRSQNIERIIKGMDKVYQNLIEHKRKINGEIVIIKDNKIVRIKP
ncbi:MAG TPA: hypothetical protein PLI68_05380 [Bacteroidia bacterium]|nr:hypothetical protein [Bacteroidia bacterium]